MTSFSLHDIASRLSWSDLDRVALKKIIILARDEDLYGHGLSQKPPLGGDITTDLITSSSFIKTQLRSRSSGIICGLPLLPLILEVFDVSNCEFEPLLQDGGLIQQGQTLGKLSGPASSILKIERTLLNFLQHLSGIATYTARCVAALGDPHTLLLDTRKTIPGYRLLEKYAVACGGAYNHRLGLFDRVLIKDNHLEAENATEGPKLADFISKARQAYPHTILEVEVDSLKQIPYVLAGNPDVIMLDNFKSADITSALQLIQKKAFVEASGGIHLQTIHQYAHLELDFISSGALVHQSQWIDIGLDI